MKAVSVGEPAESAVKALFLDVMAWKAKNKQETALQGRVESKKVIPGQPRPTGVSPSRKAEMEVSS